MPLSLTPGQGATPPAAPLPGETCPGVAPWDAATPHRPGSDDWNGNQLQNDTIPPNPGTDPTAALLNAIMLTLTALGAVIANARLSLVASGTPFLVYVTGAASWVQEELAAAFLITRVGAGSYIITWGPPSGTTTWLATTAYTTSTFVNPPIATGFYYECTTGGTSAGTPPIWPVTVGQTVTDGTAVWTCIAQSNAFPPPVSAPGVELNVAGGLVATHTYCASVEPVTNGVHVTTQLDGALADMNFSVTIY